MKNQLIIFNKFPKPYQQYNNNKSRNQMKFENMKKEIIKKQ